jgi:hypothetical protein
MGKRLVKTVVPRLEAAGHLYELLENSKRPARCGFRSLSICFLGKRIDFHGFLLVCVKQLELSFLYGVYFYNLTFDMNLYMEKLLNRKFESYSRYEYNS